MAMIIETNALRTTIADSTTHTSGGRPLRIAYFRSMLARHKQSHRIASRSRAQADTDAGLTTATVAPMALTQTTAQAARAQVISYFALQGTPPAPPAGGWRATFGMFAGDATMDRVAEELQRRRDSERHE